MSKCIGCKKDFDVPFEKYYLCPQCTIEDIEHVAEINRCRQCGRTPIELHFHHVDGRKNSNRVTLICPECHRQVHSGKRVLKSDTKIFEAR